MTLKTRKQIKLTFLSNRCFVVRYTHSAVMRVENMPEKGIYDIFFIFLLTKGFLENIL